MAAGPIDVTIRNSTNIAQSYQVSRIYLGVVCAIASLGGVLFGFDTAVISGTLGFLQAQFSLTPILEGWLVSSALLGCILGAFLAGILSDRFGRKRIMLLSGLLFVVCAIGCCMARSTNQIIIYRLVGGLGVGIASMLSPLYIAEFSPPHLRGRLVSLYQLAITAGILLAYLSNALLLKLSQISNAGLSNGLHWIFVEEVWRGMFGVMAVPALVFFFLLMIVPESPRWLAKQGFHNNAFSILKRITGEQSASVAMKEITDSISTEKGTITQLLEPRFRKALLLGILLPIFSQITAINTIIYYGTTIFEKAGFARGSSLVAQSCIGGVCMIFTLVAIFSVDKLGRRPLLQFGSVAITASLIAMGFAFYKNYHFLVVTLICFHIACFAFSFGPITWVVISEIFPTSIRGRAMSIGTLLLWISCGLVSFTFPWLRENAGSAGTFWLYAVIFAPSIWLTWKFIPETRNKTLEQIEKGWK